MQVVYSGGSTPNPSPRLQRKTGYGRPIMPGYMTHVHPQILVQRSREKLTEGDITLRDSIPAMSKCVATLCLVLNIFLPGSGTLMAGLSVLCCSHVRPKEDSKSHCIWVNAGVALVQFLLTFLFLLGWIWSVMWGMAFLSVSKQYYYRRQNEEDKQKSNDVAKTRAKVKNTSKSCCDSREVSSCRNSINRKAQNHENDSRNHDYESHNHEYDSHNDENENRGQEQQHRHRHDSQQRHILQNSVKEPRRPESDRSGTEQDTDADKRLGADSPKTSTTDLHEADSLPLQPILILQPAPPESQIDTSGVSSRQAPEDTIMKARTRHLKIMQRKMSDNDLSPFVLTHKQLEAIVIHDMPVHAPDSGHYDSENPRDALPKC